MAVEQSPHGQRRLRRSASDEARPPAGGERGPAVR